MEYIWLIIGIIWFVVSVSNKSQKEQQKQRQQANRQQPVRPAQPRQTPSRAQTLRPAAPRPAVQPIQPTIAREALHPAVSSTPLEAHMHTPVMGEEGTGTEGMDCCHEYMLTEAAEEERETVALLDGDQSREERAQQLLNGVIMSEILGRRPVRRYGSRRA